MSDSQEYQAASAALAALREAVCRPSERLSPYEILMGLTKPKAQQQDREREAIDVRIDRLVKAQARDRRQDREDFAAREDDRGPDQDRALVIESER